MFGRLILFYVNPYVGFTTDVDLVPGSTRLPWKFVVNSKYPSFVCSLYDVSLFRFQPLSCAGSFTRDELNNRTITHVMGCCYSLAASTLLVCLFAAPGRWSDGGVGTPVGHVSFATTNRFLPVHARTARDGNLTCAFCFLAGIAKGPSSWKRRSHAELV